MAAKACTLVGSVLVAGADEFDGGDEREAARSGEDAHLEAVGEDGGHGARDGWRRPRRPCNGGDRGTVRGRRGTTRRPLKGSDVDFQAGAGVRMFRRDELRRQPMVVECVRDSGGPRRMERVPGELVFHRRVEVIEQRHESSRLESNQRPPAYKADALTTELREAVRRGYSRYGDVMRRRRLHSPRRLIEPAVITIPHPTRCVSTGKAGRLRRRPLDRPPRLLQ